jgi:uncharacterized membrane protein
VVLWQMATGKKPYDIKTLSTFELQTKVVTEKLPFISSIFNEIIQIATEKEINNRFKNCKEFLNKLNSVQNQIFNTSSGDLDNNSENTSIYTNKDKTIVESLHNTNTIPNPQINIPYQSPKKTQNSSIIYIFLGIIVIIILGVIILNKNSYSEFNDYDFDSTDAGYNIDSTNTVEIAQKVVSFLNYSSNTVYLAYAYYDNGWETIGWFKILQNSSYEITLPETFNENNIYWYAEDSNGGKWEGDDGYFCVKHPDAFHFYTTENCNEQAGFYKLDLTGTYTYQELSD